MMTSKAKYIEDDVYAADPVVQPLRWIADELSRRIGAAESGDPMWCDTVGLQAASQCAFAVASILRVHMEVNHTVPKNTTMFDSGDDVWVISYEMFIFRLLYYVGYDKVMYLAAEMLANIDRFLGYVGPRTLCQSSIHRLIAASLVATCKTNEDVPHTMSDYARLTGLDVEVVKDLELEFLARCHFSMTCTFDEVRPHYTALKAISDCYYGQRNKLDILITDFYTDVSSIEIV